MIEDYRRIIYEFGINTTWKVCKVIVAKANCVLGRHYHKKKTESFMLVSGSGTLNNLEMQLFKEYRIYPGDKHKFELAKDSILLGLATRLHDMKDDYK